MFTLVVLTISFLLVRTCYLESLVGKMKRDQEPHSGMIRGGFDDEHGHMGGDF